MVKKKTGGAQRYKAASKTQGKQGIEPKTNQNLPPKHLQRQIEKKVSFLEKVKASHEKSLAARPVIQKKRKRSKAHKSRPAGKALADFSSLSATLKELASDPSKLGSGSNPSKKAFGSALKGPKGRNLVTEKEAKRLHAVLRHPTFMADPMKAITNHLMNTCPPAVVPKQQKVQMKRKGASSMQT